MRTQYDLEMMQRGRLLQRHRELLDAHRRPRARASRRTRCSTTSPTTSCSSSTRPTSAVPAAARPVRGRPQPQGHARRARLPAARRRATTGRCGSRSSSSASTRCVFLSATPGPYELRDVARRSSSRSCAPPAWSTPRSIVQAHQGPDRRPDREINDRVDRGRPGAGHHAHQEDGRGPHRLPARAGPAGALPALARSTPSQRIEILRDLRLGEFDVLVGINLLREGLDLPEVSLVAILDADKEGFLRSETSLIQTIGRAARNVDGQVIMYADTVTDSMRRAIDETNRRRELQIGLQRRARHRPADHPQGGHRHPRRCCARTRPPPMPGKDQRRQRERDKVAARPARRCRSRSSAGSSRRSRRRCTRPPPTCASSTPPASATRSTTSAASCATPSSPDRPRVGSGRPGRRPDRGLVSLGRRNPRG